MRKGQWAISSALRKLEIMLFELVDIQLLESTAVKRQQQVMVINIQSLVFPIFHITQCQRIYEIRRTYTTHIKHGVENHQIGRYRHINMSFDLSHRVGIVTCILP